MGLQSYEASFRNIREGGFWDYYEIKRSNDGRQVVVKVVELLRNAILQGIQALRNLVMN